MQQKAGNFRRVFVFLLVVAGLLASCRWFILCGPSSTRPVDPALLLIETSDFPPGWTVWESGKYDENPNLTEGAEEVAFVSFHFTEPSAWAGQHIYRYCGEGRAAWEWEHNVYIGKDLPGPEEWWQIPEELRQIDIRADQWFIGCTDRWFREEMGCEFRARYGEYLVGFGATIAIKGREVMTIAQFASILGRIDRKIVERNALVTPK